MSEQTLHDENGGNIATEQDPMVQRISLEVKRRESSLIKELVLDNCARCNSIQGLTDDFCNLRVLSIINVGLQSLAKFPKLPKLRKLYLSDNRLSSGLENLEGCPNLTLLILAGNKFKSIDELKPLTKLSKLSILDLMNCEVTTIDGYKETMFNMLPQLKYLDNADKDGVEKDSDDEDDDDEEEDNENGDDDEEEDEYEEDDSKTGLKALYNGTFQEEDDDDEESYEGNSDEEESDEDDDLSEGDVSANPVEEAPKGEKRKRNTDDHQENGVEIDNEDDNGPPRKV
ncbi:unnamed protein product [Adineta steineri]|uniref:Acidic leucine-rich nuclear phosphoprotein 32 family member A n=1 Tax=Adineta steineri TaxID=433720 RepID=A0A818VP01_9BILA|nr:unnamed protein product [Adineta steineri]CAF3713606.1 unnamed protein product [Adineta steineri]